MNLAYLIPRIIRHFMPEQLADWMKKRHFVIKAGIETMDPRVAVDHYLDYFAQAGIDFEKKSIMIFGYGGNVQIGCEFLRHGAGRVVLCERQGLPYPKLTLELARKHPDYFVVTTGDIQPHSDRLAIVHEDIRVSAQQHTIEPVDLVLSTSVYEHLEDVENITRALAALTAKNGKQVHFIDLRDHYFQYPFEMLTYSDTIWKNLLNPTSNLNRLRIPQYESIFHKYFSVIKIIITESNINAFQKTKSRIRGEFLSGDDEIDSATRIIIESSL
jgi:hypothetical protein